MKIALLLTGNELMSGDTVDSNSAYIAQSLKDLNLVPFVKKVVGDDLALLISSIRELAQISDVLVINGGLGPTNDDLTSQALAEAMGSTISRNEYAFNELKNRGIIHSIVGKGYYVSTEYIAVAQKIFLLFFRCQTTLSQGHGAPQTQPATARH